MQTIFIQPAAPTKPPEGAACNGCGVCCLAQPCPVGMALSRQRHGACTALRWNATGQRYVCGAITEPGALVRAALPAAMRWMAPGFTVLLHRMAPRWIAAGQGCDSDLQPQPSERDSGSTTMDASTHATSHD